MRSHGTAHDAPEPKGLGVTELKRLWPYLREYRARVALALVLLAAGKGATVGVPLLLKYIVDNLETAREAPQALAMPLGLLLAYGAARFATTLFAELRDTVFGRVSERAMRRVGLTVFRHLHALELDFHVNRNTGGLSRDIERGVSGIGFILRFMVFNIIPTLLEISLVVGILLLKFSPWFAVMTAVAVVSYIAFSFIATDWRTGFVREANQADSRSNTRAVDSLLNYETVKYFTNEEFEARAYDRDLSGWEQARRKNRLSLFLLNGGQSLIIALAMTAMILLAGHHVVTGGMTLGDFVMINAFMMQLFMPLGALGFVYREMKGSAANIERLFALLEKRPAVTDPEDARELVVRTGEIEFDNVDFGYGPQRSILEGISFRVPPRHKVAIVGPSGAGKSTLVKLLFRFYDVTGGSIRIDGQDIREVTQTSLRRAIGIVPQDTVLFNTSLFENVRYGRIDAGEEEVMEAIGLAHLDDFVRRLPDGVDTLVGERGLKLSGGEKQRVAIARTLLKRPPVLVFDEATSSLDSGAEQGILRALGEMARDHTSLAIAHRLSTVVDADQILVLDQGHIVERGNHQSLLARQGVYAGLWALQQRGSERPPTEPDGGIE